MSEENTKNNKMDVEETSQQTTLNSFGLYGVRSFFLNFDLRERTKTTSRSDFI